MKIEVLGPGCIRCHKTHEVITNAANEMNVDADIQHVNLAQIKDPRPYFQLGMRLTPAVVIDGKLVLQGRVPNLNEAKNLISNNRKL